MNSGYLRLATGMVILATSLSSCKDKQPPGPSGPTEEQLDAMREECARIMPKTFSSIWVGMAEQDLITERPEAKHQAQRTDPLERRWYNEMSPTGVSVWYGVDRSTERLAVVQFAHRFISWDMFRAHSQALQERFGTSYELYTCPGATQTAAMTRLLWPRQPVAVMEAILEIGDSISVTMLVSDVDDLRASIEKQKCLRVDREKALERWIEEQVEAERKELGLDESTEKKGAITPSPVPPGAFEDIETNSKK